MSGSILFLFLIASSAYPATITQSFDSNGNPTAHILKKSNSRRPAGASQYTTPEGIELHKDIIYEYYPVFGKSFSEIIRSAAENGPFSKNKNRRLTSKLEWALAYSFNYDYTYEIDEESRTVHATIAITDVDVSYDLLVTLPALLDDTELSPVEKNLWKNYLRRLADIEHDRAKIIQDADSKKKAIDDIKELKEVVFDYTNEKDIESSVELFLKEESANIGREWIKTINKRLEEYDRPTGPDIKTRRREPFTRQ